MTKVENYFLYLNYTKEVPKIDIFVQLRSYAIKNFCSCLSIWLLKKHENVEIICEDDDCEHIQKSKL